MSQQTLDLLRQYNAWRRAPAYLPDDAQPVMPHPRAIGEAIDHAIALIEQRNELLAACKLVVEAFDALSPIDPTRNTPLHINALRRLIEKAATP